MKTRLSLFLGLGALLLTPSTLMAQGANYHQTAKIAIGGEGFWDYLTVDSDANRLYVTRGTHVVVIDTLKNAVCGDIPNTPGVHGVALAPKLGKGFTSNGQENTVTVFNMKTLKELKRIPVGKNPDAILYDPATKRVFTFNGRSNDVTAIDAETYAVLGTIPVGGKPEFAVTDAKGSIWLNVEDTSEMVALDPIALRVKKRWSIKPAEEASGLAIDVEHRTLFAVAGNEKMAIANGDTGKILATPTIGKGPDACVFDPKLHIAVSSNGQDGTLTIIDTKAGFKPIATIPTQQGARTMALDAKTHKIYLITAKFQPMKPGERFPRMQPGTAMVLVFSP